MKQPHRNYAKGRQGQQYIGAETNLIKPSGERELFSRTYGETDTDERRRRKRNPKYVHLMQLDEKGHAVFTKNIITGELSEKLRFGKYYNCEMVELDKWAKLVGMARRCGIPLDFNPSYLESRWEYYVQNVIPHGSAVIRKMKKFDFEYANQAANFHEEQMRVKEEKAKAQLKASLTKHRTKSRRRPR